ncbi:MAG: hypothetical protein JST51_03180 [Armatimonadetes bacterium]|nr:hypothetical protein [Armatimonadota bacterium]
MKVTKLLAVVGLAGAFVFCFSHQTKSDKLIDKPTEYWLQNSHRVVTNVDGLVRTKLQALDIARLHLRYLFSVDEKTVYVEKVGVYWIGYTKNPKLGTATPLEERYFVKINPLNGGVEEFGLLP